MPPRPKKLLPWSVADDLACDDLTPRQRRLYVFAVRHPKLRRVVMRLLRPSAPPLPQWDDVRARLEGPRKP